MEREAENIHKLAREIKISKYLMDKENTQTSVQNINTQKVCPANVYYSSMKNSRDLVK